MMKRGLLGLRVYVFEMWDWEDSERVMIVSKSLRKAVDTWKNMRRLDKCKMAREGQEAQIWPGYGPSWRITIHPLLTDMEY